MARILAMHLAISRPLGADEHEVTGSIRFEYGVLQYVRKIDCKVLVPAEYTSIADQYDHILMCLSEQFSKLSNAELITEAIKTASYI